LRKQGALCYAVHQTLILQLDSRWKPTGLGQGAGTEGIQHAALPCTGITPGTEPWKEIGWVEREERERGISQYHRMFGVGRDLCGSSGPTSLTKQGHPEQAAEDRVQAGLEYLQRRRLHNLPGQPVSLLWIRLYASSSSTTPHCDILDPPHFPGHQRCGTSGFPKLQPCPQHPLSPVPLPPVCQVFLLQQQRSHCVSIVRSPILSWWMPFSTNVHKTPTLNCQNSYTQKYLLHQSPTDTNEMPLTSQAGGPHPHCRAD